jgi:hypothetical protein
VALGGLGGQEATRDPGALVLALARTWEMKAGATEGNQKRLYHFMEMGTLVSQTVKHMLMMATDHRDRMQYNSVSLPSKRMWIWSW